MNTNFLKFFALIGFVVCGVIFSVNVYSGDNDFQHDNDNTLVNVNKVDSYVQKDNTISKEDSKTNISHYSNLGDFKGIELYAWKDNDKYCFGLMSGTNRIKTTEERLNLKNFPLTIEEVDYILNSSPKVVGGIVHFIDNSINDKEVDDLKDILSNYRGLSSDGNWRIMKHEI